MAHERLSCDENTNQYNLTFTSSPSTIRHHQTEPPACLLSFPKFFTFRKKCNDVYFFRKHTFLAAVDTRPHQQLPAVRETKQQQRELLKADSYLKTGSNHIAHPQSCSRQASNSKFILSHSLFFSDFMCALSDLISCITSYDE